MDEVLKSALEFSNYQNTLSMQRKNIKQQFESKLTYGFNGGIFKIDQTLMSFVQMLCEMGRTNGVVILDSNETPIIIEDLTEFRDEIFNRYLSSAVDYYNKYQEIKKSRSVEKLLQV